ncbi:ATP-dependent exoDNAse (exonuclease V) alpha subunit [Labrenzia sp. EL_195]|nr:ATP-dependent exoDNAse (exonuclease V) alpha subunit [Labrenzia sp. EL_195]
MVDLETRGVEASRLALAHRRKDAHAINQAIRSARKIAGDLEGEVLFKTRHGQRAFASGDRVVFTRNDPTLGVRNGSHGIVRQADDGSLTVELDGSRTSREITISPRQYNSIDHGYATTIHKSQGATVDKTFVVSSKRMDRHLTYVAMSRHREGAKIYATPSAWRELKREKVQLRNILNRRSLRR